MSFDLEDELLRLARAVYAWRSHVAPASDPNCFTCSELSAFIAQSHADNHFPRLAHSLVAPLIPALAEMLVQADLFERKDAGSYALTVHAFERFEREPASLARG